MRLRTATEKAKLETAIDNFIQTLILEEDYTAQDIQIIVDNAINECTTEEIVTVPQEKEVAPVPDLMENLKASLELHKKDISK